MGYNELRNTPHVGLPQWSSDDKPERMDFNEAFEKIDTTIGEKLLGKKFVEQSFGTWTPRLIGRTKEGTHQYDTQIGEYCLTGDEVTLHFFLRAVPLDPTTEGVICIADLPFACRQDRATGSLLYIAGFGALPYPIPLLGMTKGSKELVLNCTNGERTTSINMAHNTLGSCVLIGSIRYGIERE